VYQGAVRPGWGRKKGSPEEERGVVSLSGTLKERTPLPTKEKVFPCTPGRRSPTDREKIPLMLPLEKKKKNPDFQTKPNTGGNRKGPLWSGRASPVSVKSRRKHWGRPVESRLFEKGEVEKKILSKGAETVLDVDLP